MKTKPMTKTEVAALSAAITYGICCLIYYLFLP